MDTNQELRQQDRQFGDEYRRALQIREKEMPSVTDFGSRNIGIITTQEIADLYRDPIGGRCVDALPEAAAAALANDGVEFQFKKGVSKAEQKRLGMIFNETPWQYGDREGFGLIGAVEVARKEARLQGDSWLLWDKNEQQFKILPFGKIPPHKKPDYALRLIGLPFPWHLKTVANRGNCNLSILQKVKDAIFSYRGMIQSVNRMMANPSVFLHGMSNISETTATKECGWIYKRLIEFNQSLALFQVAMYDKDFEEVKEVSRDLSQIPEIWDRYENAIVAASGLPRFVVLGSPGASGLASGSEAETKRWVDMVNGEMTAWVPWLQWALKQAGGTNQYTMKLYPQTPSTSTERAQERLLDLEGDMKEYEFRRIAFGDEAAKMWLQQQYPMS